MIRSWSVVDTLVRGISLPGRPVGPSHQFILDAPAYCSQQSRPVVGIQTCQRHCHPVSSRSFRYPNYITEAIIALITLPGINCIALDGR